MNSKGIKKGFDEFGEIVKITMEKVIIPLLPVYIFTMICEMSAKGVIAVVIGAGAKIDRISSRKTHAAPAK